MAYKTAENRTTILFSMSFSKYTFFRILVILILFEQAQNFPMHETIKRETKESWFEKMLDFVIG